MQKFILVVRMPPKKKQCYADRVAKRRRVVGQSATASDAPVQPHPSLLQPVQSRLQDPLHMVAAPTQLPLSQEVLTTLSNTITAAVSRALQNVTVTPSATVAVPEVQFIPDSVQESSSAVNGGPDLTEPNPSSGNVDQTIQHTVYTAVQQVTASLLPCAVASPQSKNTFLSASVSLTHRVPDRVKKLIWADEYVDFTLLLNNSLTQADDHYTFRLEKGEGNKPALILAPNPKRQVVQSIEQWVSAFQVFVAIYSEKAPQDTPALMKYGSVIRELASQGANWKFYDENFRSIRQTQGAPWDQIHAELWLRSHYFRAKPSTQLGKSKQNGQSIPEGFCWKFHRGLSCPGCSYKHQCFRCGNSHPISKCQQAPKPFAGNAGPKPTSFTNRGTYNRSPPIQSTPNPSQS